MVMSSTFFISLCIIGYYYCHAIVRFGDIIPRAEEKKSRPLMNGIQGFAQSRHILIPSGRPRLMINETIEFELFNGEIAVGKVRKVVNRGSEGSTWLGDIITANSGDISGSMYDRFTLACHLDACSADIVLESTSSHYAIRPAHGEQLTPTGSGIYALSRFGDRIRSGTNFHGNVHTVSKLQEENHMIAFNRENPTDEVDDDSILDIGVIFTPESLLTFGNSEVAMINQIHMATDATNDIMERSDISLRLRIVFTKPTKDPNFKEPGNTAATFSTLLNWLRIRGDGHLDEAHEYRDKYQADVVLLVNKASAYAGMAYVLDQYAPDHAFGNYNSLYVDPVTWAHELGHIQGCNHDRFSVSFRIQPGDYAFGNCWEDATEGAPRCRCYKSVMVYDCQTTPNNCRSCSERPFYANENVMDAGSPTGLPEASCGRYMEVHKGRPISYRKSIYNSGLIFSATPPSTLVDQCLPVTIEGWMLAPEGSIISVTLSGVEAEILSFNMHSVTVQSPRVKSFSTYAGDIVVSTDTGRRTVLRNAWRFNDMESRQETDLSKGLESTPWRSTGDINWAVMYLKGEYYLSKGIGQSVSQTAELTTLNLNKITSSNSCLDTLLTISFEYWAYSHQPSCYGAFTLSTRKDKDDWSTFWSGTTNMFSDANSAPYIPVLFNLPFGTTEVQFKLTTTDSGTSCQKNTPLLIRRIVLYKSSFCDAQECSRPVQELPPPPPPSVQPTISPTTSPTLIPTSPTLSPTTSAPTLKTAHKLLVDLKEVINFDGKTSFLYYDSLKLPLTTEFTMAGWIQTKYSGVALMTLGRNPNNYLDEVVFYIEYYDGVLGLWDYGSKGYGFDGYSTGSVSDGERNHVAFVKKGTVGIFYINGKPSGRMDAAYSVNYRNSDFVIGKDYRNNAGHFKGTMDGVKVYQGAMTADEINQLYSSGVKTPLPSSVPSTPPTLEPSSEPTTEPPSLQPTSEPSYFPSEKPTKKPKNRRKNKRRNKRRRKQNKKNRKKRRKNKNNKRKNKNKNKNKNINKPTRNPIS